MVNEIILNHLTGYEVGRHLSNPEREGFENYKEHVILLFHLKDMYLFESDILKEYKEKSMERLLETYPCKFYPAGKRNKKVKMKDLLTEKEDKTKTNEKNKSIDDLMKDFEQAWFDIGLHHFNITKNEPYYDLFFVYQLRNLDLLETDDFLNYQLVTYFDNKISAFKSFVLLSVRKHGAKLMSAEQKQTVEEWLAMIETTPTLSGTEPEKDKRIKGRIQRKAEDGKTCLTALQTALLIEFMQKADIALKGDYLNFTQIGEAIDILTGYSPNNARQNVGSKGAKQVSHADYKEVYEAVMKMAKLIESHIK